MKAWLKGGLIGAGIGFIIMMVLWVNISIKSHCLVIPTYSPGGASCNWFAGFLLYQSILSFIISTIATIITFAIVSFLGFIPGALIGWLVGKLKK